MELTVKTFDELTVQELYEILKLRSDVFVVEQKCIYPDPDNRDQEALHLFLKDSEGIQGYLRVLKPADGTAALIGRVIAAKRRCGIGSRLVQAGLKAAAERFRASSVLVEAQSYAEGFYASLGFVPISEEFLDYGIPHIKMLREIR